MWPFGKSKRTRPMARVILTNGREIVGEEGLSAEVFVGTAWIRHNYSGGYALYPHHRVLRIEFWQAEVEWIAMRCPICNQENPIEVLDVASVEADNLCLLCEAEGICPSCSQRKHPDKEEVE